MDGRAFPRPHPTSSTRPPFGRCSSAHIEGISTHACNVSRCTAKGERRPPVGAMAGHSRITMDSPLCAGEPGRADEAVTVNDLDPLHTLFPRNSDGEALSAVIVDLLSGGCDCYRLVPVGGSRNDAVVADGAREIIPQDEDSVLERTG